MAKSKYLDVYGEEYDPNMLSLPEGLTAEQVIDDYIDAIGGKEKLAAVTDRVNVLKGKIQGMDLSITISQKAPNKFKMELNAGPMQQVQKFDGTKGVAVVMGPPQPIEGDDLENLKIEAMMFPEVQYTELGVKVELAGIEKINDKDTYKVFITLPTGKTKTQYFETESKLLVKETAVLETPQGNFPQISEFSDYKEVEGILYPHVIQQQMGPQMIPLEVESITVNQGIDDSVFIVE